MSSPSLDTWLDQYVGQWLSQTTFSEPELKSLYSNHPEIVRKRKRTDGGENEMEDSVNRNSLPARPLTIPHLSTGASSAYDSPGSSRSATSKTSIKRKLEVLEYNSTPALAWHLMPTDLPSFVGKLLVHLTLSADGCESVPSSLKETIQSDPNLASEAFSRFVWSTPSVNTGGDPDIPSPEATRLWSFVQEILQQSRLLAFQRAEESEYYPLVQKILSLDPNQSDLEVRQVTTAKFNPHHLPQGPVQISPTKRPRCGIHKTISPVLDSKVDISIEYKLPDQLTQGQSTLLPWSLIAALRRSLGSTWVFGPYPRPSVVTCVVEVKTTLSASRLEAEFQAAVGGVCMIQARMELVDMIKRLKTEVPPPDGCLQLDKSLLDFMFPVLTLVVMGDTWYYQVVYLRTTTDCVVLPLRMAGDTLTHLGVFKLLKFVDTVRVWCLNYAREFILLLRALGMAVGWREE